MKQRKHWKKAVLLLCLIMVGSLLGACSKQEVKTPAPTQGEAVAPEEPQTPEETQKQEEPAAARTKINVALLKGPTGIGAVKLMEDKETGTTANDYQFQVAGAPDEVVAKVVSGEVDIAAVPTNLAATLYKKTEGNVQMIAANTLGVLYILENGQEIQSVADLSGKTIYATGQGATPEYVLNFILEQNGITDATIEYLAEHAELAAKLSAGEAAIGMLPEPNVTAVMMKNKDTRIALDLTKEWDAACQKAGDTGNQLVMGAMIVNKEFADNNKDAVDQFLEEYRASIQFVNEKIPDAAALVEKFEIMPAAKAAEKAIPNCNIFYMDGAEMETAVKGSLQVLFDANPKSVGGTLPDDNFYYKK